MKRQYKGLDIAKFFFSWVVVAIHTELLLDTPAVYRPLMRYFMSAAVPVFFIISGFLCGNKYLDSDRRPEVIRNSVKSLLRLYGIWGGIYFLIDLLKSVLSQENIGDVLLNGFHRLVVYGPGGAIWYVYALIVISLVTMAILKLRNKNTTLVFLFLFLQFMTMIPPLLALDCFKTPVIEKIQSWYIDVFLSYNNALFYGSYYVGGYLIAVLKRRYLHNWSVGGFCGLAAVLLINNLFGSHPLCIPYTGILYRYCIFIIFLELGNVLPEKITTISYRKISQVVYFTHVLVIYASKAFMRFLPILPKQGNIVLFLVTIGILVCYYKLIYTDKFAFLQKLY